MMKRLFPPFLSFDDERCQHTVPRSLSSVQDAVLYISGEVSKGPKSFPFSSKNKRLQTVDILTKTLLDRLLFRCDNNATRNYLIGAIEYCLLSSSTMQHLSEEKDKDGDDAKDEALGLITNALFLTV